MVSYMPFVLTLLVATDVTSDKIRHDHRPCKILINVFLFAGTESDFIEVTKQCPGKGKQNYNQGLHGHWVLVLKGKDQLKIVYRKDLETESLVEPRTAGPVGVSATAEEVPGCSTACTHEDNSRSLRHHVEDNSRSLRRLESEPPRNIEQDESRSLRILQHNENKRTRRGIRMLDNANASVYSSSNLSVNQTIRMSRPRRVPKKPDNPNSVTKFLVAVDVSYTSFREDELVVIVLAYYRAKKPHFVLEEIVDEKRLKSICSHIKDVALIGSLPSIPLLTQVNAALGVNLIQDNLFTLPKGLPLLSVNRCDGSLEKISKQKTENQEPSKWKVNNCKNIVPAPAPPVTEAPPKPQFPYGFTGQTIGVHGQKIIVNLLWSLKINKNNVDFFKKSDRDVASALINLHSDTIHRFELRYNDGKIGEKLKRKERQKPIRGCVDAEMKELIYNVISAFYSRKQVPTLAQVHKNFLAEIQRREGQASGGIQASDNEEGFTCNVDTFRKILHASGYHWGTINKRDSVLYDPRIISLRGRYLNLVRANDALGDRKIPVLYTDETWFDIHSRQKKGWVKKGCLTWKEKQDFTFLNSKQSRGPRIIILHIGGIDGFIHEVMEVYPVSSAKSDVDYHSNVHGKKYLQWFNRVMDYLKDKGPHIIVMDNAPYHSTLNAPRIGDRKAKLLDWLLQQKQLGKTLPELGNLRRAELEDLVRKLKKEDPPYIIDTLARENGHKIFRLAPYNCDLNPIEFVWSDVKRLLRDQNADQNTAQNVIRARSIMTSYKKEQWQAHIAHVKKLEQEYWDGDLEWERTVDGNNELENAAHAIVEESIDDEDFDVDEPV